MKNHLYLLLFILVLSACTAVSPEPNNPASERVTAVPSRIISPTATVPFNPSPVPTAVMATPTAIATPTQDVPSAPTHVPPKIQFAPTENWQISEQYGGTMQTITLNGTTALIGAGLRLLLVDISDPTNPTLLGRTDRLPDSVHEIVVIDNIAYVATGLGGLTIVDIAEPTAPKIIQHIDEIEGDPAHIVHVIANNNRLFTTTHNESSPNYLYTFDPTDPQNLTLVASEEIPANAQMFIDNGRFYLMTQREIQLRDASTPATILDTYPITSSYPNPALLIAAGIGYFSPKSYSPLQLLDLNAPNSIQLLGQGPTLNSAREIALIDNTLFISSLYGEFGYCSSLITAVNLTEPTNPQTTAEWNLSQCILDMKNDEQFLYTVGRQGLTIYDIESLQNNTPLATFINPDGFLDVQTVNLGADNTLQITSAESGQTKFLTLNAQGKTSDPLLIEAGSIDGAFSLENTWITPAWSDGLRIVDVTNPDVPNLAVNWPYDTLPSTDFLTSAVWNNHFYMPVFAGGLGKIGIVDLNDPFNPEWVATFKTKNSMIAGMTTANGRLFVYSQETSRALEVFDLTDPTSPSKLGDLPLHAMFTQLAVVADTLYAACVWGNCHQLLAIDISDPANMTIRASYPLAPDIIKMVAAPNNNIYLLTQENGLWIMNVTNAPQPVITSQIPLPNTPTDITMRDGQIVVATGDGGLIILASP